MTEVCLSLPKDSFASACSAQQAWADAVAKPAVLLPRGAHQREEVFIPIGTREPELTALLHAKLGG